MGKREDRKMVNDRKSFQGVSNIIRFNWHFYVLALLLLIVLLSLSSVFPSPISIILIIFVSFVSLTLLISLSVSYYIYDTTDLYELNWLGNINGMTVLNVNAGFDETSGIISAKFPTANLTICDFYNSEKHTEISIKRARVAYPPQPGSLSVSTEKLPFEDNTFDKVIAIFCVHEIRNDIERSRFLEELNRVTKNDGQLLITEHIRDWKNFFAYSIGFFHFLSKKTWLKNFHNAKFNINRTIKNNPLITTYILENNGNTF